MLTSLVTKAQWPSLYSLGVVFELPLGGFGWKYHAIGHEVDVTSAVPLHSWCLGRSWAVNGFLAGKALEVCGLLDSQWGEEGVSTAVQGDPEGQGWGWTRVWALVIATHRIIRRVALTLGFPGPARKFSISTVGLGWDLHFFLKMDCWTQKGNTSKQTKTNKASRAAPRWGKPWGLCSRQCFLRCGFHSTVCLVGKGGKGTSKLLCLQATGSVLWSHSCEQSVPTWGVLQTGCWDQGGRSPADAWGEDLVCLLFTPLLRGWYPVSFSEIRVFNPQPPPILTLIFLPFLPASAFLACEGVSSPTPLSSSQPLPPRPPWIPHLSTFTVTVLQSLVWMALRDGVWKDTTVCLNIYRCILLIEQRWWGSAWMCQCLVPCLVWFSTTLNACGYRGQLDFSSWSISLCLSGFLKFWRGGFKRASLKLYF